MDADASLKNHRQDLVLTNLKTALGDAIHHLKWLEHRNDIEAQSQDKIKQMEIEDPLPQIEMDQNTKQHQDYFDTTL